VFVELERIGAIANKQSYDQRGNDLRTPLQQICLRNICGGAVTIQRLLIRA
jgi:hypothetical protein